MQAVRPQFNQLNWNCRPSTVIEGVHNPTSDLPCVALPMRSDQLRVASVLSVSRSAEALRPAVRTTDDLQPDGTTWTSSSSDAGKRGIGAPTTATMGTRRLICALRAAPSSRGASPDAPAFSPAEKVWLFKVAVTVGAVAGHATYAFGSRASCRHPQGRRGPRHLLHPPEGRRGVPARRGRGADRAGAGAAGDGRGAGLIGPGARGCEDRTPAERTAPLSPRGAVS